jgi:2-polyprenyl-3-methyl-5-hydroxy-6-metoxy-1,4-benzoquinol methylase
LAEFTGERVVPGEVDADLWNEHFARYAFASRLSRRKRVLDAGCGAGYGTAELARGAATVVGLDVSAEALKFARLNYPLPNAGFLQASCAALPFAGGSFDLVTVFEVIEHIREWRECLREIRRVLAPAGQCVISTPNRDYYADSRGTTGPNPYHEHEFSFEEFSSELSAVFPHVSMFVQNHVEGLVFQPAKTSSQAEARVDGGAWGPRDAHFFLAVCALAPQTGAPTFLYVPKAANVLRERERHIEGLGRQLAEITAERDSHIEGLGRQLAEITAERDSLLRMFRDQKEELEERNRWAVELNQTLEEAGISIRGLQEELGEKVEWAMKTGRELDDKCRELAGCVDALHQAEATIEERTKWAQERDSLAQKLDSQVRELENQVRELEARLSLVRSSRWIRLGNTLGLGPRLGNE